jgi:mersacidin/lichenicidin family type 2 lantibiotic
MNNIDIIRAWKDAEYRKSLSSEELALVPESPVGQVELTEADLTQVSGGTLSVACSVICQSVVCTILGVGVC